MSTHLVLASNRRFPWYEIKNKKTALSNIASPVAQLVKNPPAKQETPVPSLGWEIPWTEEPGGLQSIGSQRVGHDLRAKHLLTYLQFKNFSKRMIIYHLFLLVSHSIELF